MKKSVVIISVVIIIAIVIALIVAVPKNSEAPINDSSKVISAEASQNIEDNASAVSNDNGAISNKKDTVSKGSTSASEKNKADKSTEKSEQDNSNEEGLTVEQAEEILTNFYGSTYVVTAGERNGFLQEFSIVDKKGGDYATVSVNLSTGDATEKITGTNEVNDYNLLV